MCMDVFPSSPSPSSPRLPHRCVRSIRACVKLVYLGKRRNDASSKRSLERHACIYIYIYIYTYMYETNHTYIYIYIHILAMILIIIMTILITLTIIINIIIMIIMIISSTHVSVYESAAPRALGWVTPSVPRCIYIYIYTCI